MIEPTMYAVLVGIAFGVLGGVANEAYAYLKMGEAFSWKECGAKMLIGGVVGILVPMGLLTSFLWSAWILGAFLAGYCGIDAIEFIIGKKAEAKKEVV